MNWYLRFQRYQDNPRQFSFQNRRLSSNRNLPSPSHVPSVNAKTNYKPSHKKKTMPIMNYSQKKEALKKLLISANLRNSSVSKKGNIKPLASTLLQALKEKRPTLKQTNRPQKFSQHLQESRKDPPNKIIQHKEDISVLVSSFKIHCCNQCNCQFLPYVLLSNSFVCRKYL